MSEDRKNGVIKTLAELGSNGAIIIVVLVFLGFSTWTNMQQTENNNKQTEILEEIKQSNDNIERLIEQSRKIEEFRECVGDVSDELNEIFQDDLLQTLGTTLGEYQVPFPQNLNESISNFRISLNKLPKCLIDPKKVK